MPTIADGKAAESAAREKNDNSLESLLSPLSSEMDRLGEVIDHHIVSDHVKYFPEVSDLAHGGKRLRGAICIASAKVFTADPERLEKTIEAACYIEGIHLTSLLHDDIIDSATERRGVQTLHQKYGRTGAILAGDLLYVKIFQKLLDFGNDKVVREITRGTKDMVEGETLETLAARGNSALKMDRKAAYFKCISKKTASFFRSAALSGATIGLGPQASNGKAAGSAEILENFSIFGNELGMVFQIVDDILDWKADPDLLGKDLLSDIKNSKLTLPAILFLEDDKELAQTSIKRAQDGDVAQLISEIMSRGYLEQSHRVATQHADAAQNALNSIDHDTSLLEQLITFSLDRFY